MSNNVEPPRNGKDPPSTRASRLSSNWDRISSAFIAEDKPVLFALVAVMGFANRFTSFPAKGAAGQRRPMLWVPAVTFFGRCG